MKNFIQLVLLVAFSTVMTAQNTVTFQVDMNDYAGSFTTVYVSGDFNGWSGNANAMSDPNSDGVWEVSLPLTNDSIEFKYTLDNWAGQENLTAGTSCTKTSFGFTNRFLVITSNVTLPVNCYESCGACTGVVTTPPSLPLDWDDATISYAPISFGGIIDSIKPDPTDPGNTVLKQDKGLGTQTWAGTTLLTNTSALPFTSGGANIMQVRFWSPDANVPVRLKVEDASNAAISVETEDTTSMAGAWEVLTFDFNNEASGTAALNTANTYDKISLFPNFGTDGNTAGAKAYYIDDVVFGTLNTAMSGVYTIDPAGSGSRNYASFSAAAADLVSLGVSGAVTFNVAAGSYTDTVYLPAIMGTSATNTILFDGGDSATTSLAYNTAANNQRAVILMDGADYVTFKGLTITHSGTTDSWGIRMTNDNDYFNLDGCRIEMPATTSTSEITCLGSSGSATSQYVETEAGDNITITNSAFINGTFGVHFESDDPTTSTFTDSNIVVSNNVFEGNYYRYFMSDNTYMTTFNGNTASGMAYSFGYGVAIYDVIGFEINNNNIQGPDWGIYISDGNFDGTPPGTSNITNNMIVSANDEALYCDDIEDANIYYNSCVVSGSSSTSAYGAYFNDFYNLDIKNNVFYSESAYAVYFSDNTTSAGTTSGVITVDNNAYYTVSGSNLAYDAGAQADLTAWQTARAGNNASSVAGDPIFVNPASDLHVAGGLLNGAATPIAAVTMDIDGDMRDATTPDIGADEYTPASCLPALSFTDIATYADSARVAWADPNGTGNTYTIEYGAAGFTPGMGTLITAHPDTFVVITGLMAATDYEFYVTIDCGANGTASQSGPGAFRTACATYMAPYSTDFENISLGNIADYENCWSTMVSSNPAWYSDVAGTSSSSTGPSVDHTSGTSTGIYMYLETSSPSGLGDTNVLYSPYIDISSLTVPQVDFWYHMYGQTMGNIYVYAEDLSGSRTLLDSVIGEQQFSNSDPWALKSIVASGLTGSVYRFQIVGEAGSSFYSDMAIDDFSVTQAPTCFPPSALGLASATTTSADVYWTPGNASNWIVEYGPVGFTQGTGSTMIATNDTVTISGLTAATAYDFYVADSCAVGDVSTFTGPFTFYTETCLASAKCTYTLDLYDTYGDGWNGNEITVWQAGVPVGTYGANFTSSVNGGDSLTGITLDLCDGLPTYVTLSTLASWSQEMEFNLSNPLGAVQGIHNATTGLGQGDTLVMFNTDCSACPALIAPFYESFDGTSTPTCWSQSAGLGGPWLFSTSINSVNCAAIPDNTGNGGNYAWMDQSGSDDSVSLEMPVIDVSGLTTPYIEFYYAMCGSGYSPVNITIIEYWDGMSWQTADTLDFATNGWQKIEDTIPAGITYGGGLLKLRFRAESGGNSLDFYGDNGLDDIRIYEAPSCFTPSNLGATNITASSADIFWTTGGASNWIVEYGPAGFTPGTGSTMIASNDTVSLSGLMAATSYDFYVADSCGAGDVSLQSGPYNFNTACAPVLTAPYSNGFEGISFGNLASYENCWTTNVGSNPAWYSDAGGTSSGSTGPNADNTLGTSAGTYMYLETSSPSGLGDTNVLYSPVFDWSGMTSPMLSFYYHMYGQTMGNLRIWAEDASGVRTALDSIVGQQQLSGADAWLEKTILLTGLPAGNYRILFEGVAGSSFYSDMAIDDFSIVEAPQCFPSSNLSLISAGNTSATVTWTAGQGTSWDVEYGPAGFTPGTGTMVNSTNDTLTITGLTALTAYDFYVTDSCGANGVATTAGPGSFTTAACPLADQCNYTFDLFDTFGDGWNGGEIKIYQNGVQVASLGGSFTAGNSSLGNLVSICDNQPIVVTLDPAGGWPSEIGVIAIQPNGDTAGVHVASSSVGTGDTLFSFTSNCSSCITYPAPFFESFEINSPSIACWTNEAVSDTSLAWTIGTGSSGGAITTAYAGNNNAVYVSQGPSGAADTTRLVSPVLDLTSLLSPQLSFWYAQEDWFGDQNITNVYYRASASDPWTFLFGDNTNKSAWTLATMSLPNPSSTYQIAIEGINNWGRANVVDSLSITDAAVVCSMPDSVMAMNVTATSADISWVSGTNASSSWIEYGPVGFTPGTGTVVNPATSATTLSGLMPGTLYEACVYDICTSLGDTSMAACTTFATLCAPISSFPYMEDFDNGVIPPCYSETATGSAYTWRPNSGPTSSTNTGPAGDNTTGTGWYMYVEASSPAAAGDSAFLWTAEFDMTSLSNPEIVYYYHMYGADIVNLDFQAYDRSTMTWVSLNNIVGQQQTSNGDAWLEARVNLAAYTTDTALQLRFLSVRGASFDGDAALDDIMIRETPPCVDASNFMATNATSSSVSLSWNSDTNIVSSTIQYGAPGFMLGSGTNVSATPGGFTVTGLATSTCYDFYVMDSCSSATNWVGPITVCTIGSCSISSVPSSTTNDTTDCDGGPTTLMATSSTSNDMAWIVNGIVRETGDTYNTDSVSFTTAFDVAEYVTTSPALHVGPMTNIATAGFGNFSNGQYITVHDTIHIDSMTVRHQGDVIAFAQLWDASITNVLQRGDTFSTPASITADMRVPVNMVVTPGVYFMNVDFLSGAGALFRATGGAQYPYDLAGLMSIDSTNFASQVRIYYTFDITVSKACIGSPAQAFAVVPGANAGISDTSLVCSSDNAANMAAFLGVHDNGGTWVDNDATGANTDSILDATMLTAGNIYHFSYIVPGVNGCAGDTAEVYIEIEAAPFGGVDTSAAYCAGSGIKILRNLLTGTAFGGSWVDVDGSGALNTNTGVFNSNNATAGTYRMQYILSGVACPADTTTITVTVDDPVSAGVAVSDTVCDDESMVDLNTFLDASATAGGMWTDLSGTGALSGNMFDATAVANMSSYNFQYKVMSACGDDSITVTLYVDDCDVSVRELSTGFINIYPNPTTGLIKIDDENVRGNIKVEVFAGNGQLMISEEYAEGEEIRLDISEYAAGIYTVKVNSSKGLDVKRIMKQ